MKKKNTIWIFPLIIMCFVMILTNRCKKDDKKNPTVPVLSTSDVSDITFSTAICGGNIASDGGSIIIARGVCWSTVQNPDIDDNKTMDGIGDGSFTSAIIGINPYTTYYVRAYSTNSAGTGYGNEISFTSALEVGTFADLDSNIYHTVTIGTQIWMVENLKTTKYRDGSAVPQITDGTSWSKLTTGAYCNYNNDANNFKTYGRLYNWFAVNDSHNLAPNGWHIPSNAEWTTLITYLGGGNYVGGKLKETGLTHWNSPNTGATNESGFTALPGGMRDTVGSFAAKGLCGYWWSSTEQSTTNAWIRALTYNYSYGFSYTSDKINGFSVRCVKD